jgi:transposase-like protein
VAELPGAFHAQRAHQRAKRFQDMVASIIRTAFAMPDAKQVHAQYAEVNQMLGSTQPKVVAMFEDARDDELAFAGFPPRHWCQVWSTNPTMERVHKEIKRRTNVVVVFPNPAALPRLTGAVLVEQHDEWEAGDRAEEHGPAGQRNNSREDFAFRTDGSMIKSLARTVSGKLLHSTGRSLLKEQPSIEIGHRCTETAALPKGG